MNDTQKLKEDLRAFAEWLNRRAEGDHNTGTTLTMMRKRAAEIEQKFTRGRVKSENPENSSGL